MVAGGLLLFFFFLYYPLLISISMTSLNILSYRVAMGGMLDPYCFREPRRAPLVSFLVILMGEGIGGERCASLAASDMIGGCSMTILLGVRERAI